MTEQDRYYYVMHYGPPRGGTNIRILPVADKFEVSVKQWNDETRTYDKTEHVYTEDQVNDLLTKWQNYWENYYG